MERAGTRDTAGSEPDSQLVARLRLMSETASEYKAKREIFRKTPNARLRYDSLARLCFFSDFFP